ISHLDEDSCRWDQASGPQLEASLTAATTPPQPVSSPLPETATPQTSADTTPQTAAKSPDVPQQTKRVVATGSGFYISNSALLLTNYHVIEGCTSISTPGTAASIVGVDAQNDLALLSTPRRSGAVASLRANPPIRAGERVVAIGFPLTGILAEQA